MPLPTHQRLPATDKDLTEEEMEGLVLPNNHPLSPRNHGSNGSHGGSRYSLSKRPLRAFILMLALLAVLSALMSERENSTIEGGGLNNNSDGTTLPVDLKTDDGNVETNGEDAFVHDDDDDEGDEVDDDGDGNEEDNDDDDDGDDDDDKEKSDTEDSAGKDAPKTSEESSRDEDDNAVIKEENENRKNNDKDSNGEGDKIENGTENKDVDTKDNDSNGEDDNLAKDNDNEIKDEVNKDDNAKENESNGKDDNATKDEENKDDTEENDPNGKDDEEAKEEENKDGEDKDTDANDKDDSAGKDEENKDGKVEENDSNGTDGEVINEEDEKIKEALIEKWGKWHFWDGEEDSRPTEDYLSAYPNKDCPAEKFPFTAWQGDAVYVNHFLDSGSELVIRTKEAIYTEYGWGPRKEMEPQQLVDRRKMFKLHYVDFEKEPNTNKAPEGSLNGGGWTTKKSFKALSKRLIHSMMTNDDFTVVLGGHSAAAGHGNHFLQSYTMQFQKILEPVFRRLGMNLVTRNLARGGLGTMQDALGSGSMYGDNVDMIIWDSSMTENQGAEIELFCRQALIGGKRPPVLWGGHFDVLKNLHLETDADIMESGSAMVGVPITENNVQVKTLPWAAQYLQCARDNRDICDAKENRFRTTCWVDRDDVTPPTKQDENPGSQVSWHPGFRTHQLKARALAFTVLEALQDAIDTWSEITIFAGHPLPDEYWHITEHYENIKKKARNLSSDVGECSSLKDFFPERVCTTPLQARTQFTPRPNPTETSITGIVKKAQNGYLPELEEKMLYDGPDVPNPSLMVPDGEIDVTAIVSNRRNLVASNDQMFLDLNDMALGGGYDETTEEKNHNYVRRRTNKQNIVPGHGWEVSGGMPGNCDGTSTGICGRLSSSKCLLYGHMDDRGGLMGNALSGWLVMNISNVKEGLIILKIETWHKDENNRTKQWKEVNNAEYADEGRRELGGDVELPDDLVFDYSIDGEVTTLTKKEFNEKITKPQRVVELLTILDDPEMAKNNESKDMEVGIRLRNCDRRCTFRLTHVYWA